MRTFFDPRQHDHAPAMELHNGAYVPYAEHRGRMENVLEALGEVEAPRDYGIEPIRRVHRDNYLEFLQTAHPRWVEAGRQGDAHGYAWPVVGRRPLKLNRIDADLGQFSFDASSPISAASDGSCGVVSRLCSRTVPSTAVVQDEVGEGAADVHAEPKASHSYLTSIRKTRRISAASASR